MSRKIVIVNGSGDSGKDTFVDACIDIADKEFGLSAVKCSSVSPSKTAALLLGWNGEKDEKGREFLHRIKMLSSEFFDGPMRHMEKCLLEWDADITFLFIREPSEIKTFVKKYPGTITVLLDRPCADKYHNEADAGVGGYGDYDRTIANYGSIEKLVEKATSFVRDLIDGQ